MTNKIIESKNVTKKGKADYFTDKLVLYDKLIAANSAIERKGATLPYTSVNGNMFTFLSGDGDLSIRLPEIEREKFIKKFKTCLSVQHGVTMKEYLVVPESLFRRISVIQTYVDISFNYALTLKPKVPKKKSQ